MKPFKNNIIIEQDKEESKFIVIGKRETKQTGTIIETGEEVKKLKKGDKIIFKKYSAEKINVNDKEYLICEDSDILALIK